MEFFMPIPPDVPSSLGMAIVMSSVAPLILLDKQLIVQAASGSFCRSFSIDPASVVGTELFALGRGEWNIPQLRSLLKATASGSAAIAAYEMDLKRPGQRTRRLMLNAHVLDHPAASPLRIVLAVDDITEMREAERVKDALARDRILLVRELHHRVANSLQIIASVLMQRVRRSQSEETRSHLRDAHLRVMSIAALERQLASTASGDVALGPYFTELCASIGASMIQDPAHLTLTVDVDDSATSADRSVSMGLIITELVINSLKHAFRGDTAKGKISVSFHATPEGWTMAVADDGAGLPADPEKAKPGLGTGIVNALAEQLAATVTVTDAKPGTLVSIVHVDKTLDSRLEQDRAAELL